MARSPRSTRSRTRCARWRSTVPPTSPATRCPAGCGSGRRRALVGRDARRRRRSGAHRDPRTFPGCARLRARSLPRGDLSRLRRSQRCVQSASRRVAAPPRQAGPDTRPVRPHGRPRGAPLHAGLRRRPRAGDRHGHHPGMPDPQREAGDDFLLVRGVATRKGIVLRRMFLARACRRGDRRGRRAERIRARRAADVPPLLCPRGPRCLSDRARCCSVRFRGGSSGIGLAGVGAEPSHVSPIIVAGVLYSRRRLVLPIVRSAVVVPSAPARSSFAPTDERSARRRGARFGPRRQRDVPQAVAASSRWRGWRLAPSLGRDAAGDLPRRSARPGRSPLRRLLSAFRFETRSSSLSNSPRAFNPDWRAGSGCRPCLRTPVRPGGGRGQARANSGPALARERSKPASPSAPTPCGRRRRGRIRWRRRARPRLGCPLPARPVALGFLFLASLELAFTAFWRIDPQRTHAPVAARVGSVRTRSGAAPPRAPRGLSAPCADRAAVLAPGRLPQPLAVARVARPLVLRARRRACPLRMRSPTGASRAYEL